MFLCSLHNMCTSTSTYLNTYHHKASHIVHKNHIYIFLPHYDSRLVYASSLLPDEHIELTIFFSIYKMQVTNQSKLYSNIHKQFRPSGSRKCIKLKGSTRTFLFVASVMNSPCFTKCTRKSSPKYTKTIQRQTDRQPSSHGTSKHIQFLGIATKHRPILLGATNSFKRVKPWTTNRKKRKLLSDY